MNTNFLNSVTNFLKKRTFELLGLILILTGIALAISFATYAPEDPSFIYGDSNIEIKNFNCALVFYLIEKATNEIGNGMVIRRRPQICNCPGPNERFRCPRDWIRPHALDRRNLCPLSGR